MERQVGISKGNQSYQRWLEGLRADPEFQSIYEAATALLSEIAL
jgi:hypothetical protein